MLRVMKMFGARSEPTKGVFITPNGQKWIIGISFCPICHAGSRVRGWIVSTTCYRGMTGGFKLI